MNDSYYGEQVQGSFAGDMAKSFAFGSYSHPMGLLGESLSMAGMVNPALGVGMWTPASMFSSRIGRGPISSTLLAGYGSLNGAVLNQAGRATTMARQASLYWRANGGMRTAEAFMPKTLLGGTGAWSDRYLNWLAPQKALSANRTISAMISREVSLGGGWFSARGLGAGLEVAGLRSGGAILSRAGIGAAARLGMVGVSKLLPVVGWGMLAWDAYRAFNYAKDSLQNAAQQNYRRNFQETSVPIADSYVASTQRRQALMAIQQSRLNARSAFGYEAKRMHSL